MRIRSLVMVLGGTMILVALPGTASAQGTETCDNITRFVDREDYVKALDELTWCRRAIETLHFEKIADLIAIVIDGWQPGEPEGRRAARSRVR